MRVVSNREGTLNAKKSEIRSQRPEIRNRKSGQWSVVSDQKSEVRSVVSGYLLISTLLAKMPIRPQTRFFGRHYGEQANRA